MSGTVTATGGVPLDHVAAVAYSDATTVVTSTYTLSDGKYTIWITPGVYRVTVNAYQLPSVWYRAAADFASATNVDVSTSSATGIDVVFPAVTVSGTISGAAGGGVSSLVTVTSATCSTPSTAGVA